MLPKPACSRGFVRKLADFTLSTRWPVLRLVLSPSAHSLCHPCHRQHVEVHKVRVTRPIKSASYAWTNRVVLFQHWQAAENDNQVVFRAEVWETQEQATSENSSVQKSSDLNGCCALETVGRLAEGPRPTPTLFWRPEPGCNA